MGTLTQAKQILAKLPGVKVQDADSALKGIRPRRDYDNDFVLTGLKLPKPAGGAEGKTVPLPDDVLAVFAKARQAVHPEYLQILVNHAGRVWVFDRGMLIDVTDDTQKVVDTQKGAAKAPATMRHTAMRHNPTCAFGHKTNPARSAFKNPVAQELYDLANYGCSCGTKRKNPEAPVPTKRKADSVERFVVVDESGYAVCQVIEGRRAGNLALLTMRTNHPGAHLELVELPKEAINPARGR